MEDDIGIVQLRMHDALLQGAPNDGIRKDRHLAGNWLGIIAGLGVGRTRSAESLPRGEDGCARYALFLGRFCSSPMKMPQIYASRGELG